LTNTKPRIINLLQRLSK